MSARFPVWMTASASLALLSHRSLVNHEAFFFAGPGAKRTFDEHPERYCRLLTDPVSGERFQPREDSLRTEHGGRPFFFVTEATRKAFSADPDSFSVPHLRMMPKPGAG
jgi:YHS domain-containing protein